VKKHVALIGMMGAGKTTVGALVAQRLGVEFCDSDVLVEAATGMTVPEIFANRGEESFRNAESAALRESITRSSACVIGVAGGAVVREDNRELLKKDCLVIWLRATVDTLSNRVGDGVGRPLLGSSPRETLAAIYKERESIYESMADAVVDVDQHGPTELAFSIASLYTDLNHE
jgi:shikimate kinase